MDNKKRPAGPPSSGSLGFGSLFSRQPARVLIVDALPPWWSGMCTVLCDALDNVLSVACSLDGPCRIPLLSLYAISRQQECLLPFVVRQVMMKIFQKHIPIQYLSHACNLSPTFSLLSIFIINLISVYSKFEVIWPGFIPAWKSWGLFQVMAVSEEQPEEVICCDRPCWTVCSSLNNTWDTLALAARPAAMHIWRWVQTASPQSVAWH